jgi:hypothetical protein
VFTNFAEPAVEDVEAEPAVDEAAGAGSESDFIMGEPAGADGEAAGVCWESDFAAGLVTPSARAEPTIRPAMAVVTMSFFNMRFSFKSDHGSRIPSREQRTGQRDVPTEWTAPFASFHSFRPVEKISGRPPRRQPPAPSSSIWFPAAAGPFANDSLILSTL